MSRPLLVVYCGLPGVGKSTVSQYTAKQLGATRYRSDEVRYDLFDDPSYTPAEIDQTYEELLNRARGSLQDGENVVVDGTFKLTSQRDRAREVATQTGATIEFVRVTCPPDVVRERIDARTDDASDADLSVYHEHREAFQPLDCDHVEIDNGGSLAESREQVDRLFFDEIER